MNDKTHASLFSKHVIGGFSSMTIRQKFAYDQQAEIQQMQQFPSLYVHVENTNFFTSYFEVTLKYSFRDMFFSSISLQDPCGLRKPTELKETVAIFLLSEKNCLEGTSAQLSMPGKPMNDHITFLIGFFWGGEIQYCHSA